MLRLRVLCFLSWTIFLLALTPLGGAEQESWPEWRAPIIAKFTEDLQVLDTAVAQRPDSVPLYSRRGDCHLFLGQFPEAVADYEKMIALDPAQDAPHWRLGIAYYFGGHYAKSALQFQKYHAYDGRDRENGIWKFLAQAKVDGLERARSDMLEYHAFDREPFPSLYEMFAGKRTPDDVLAEIDRKGLAADSQVVFFGNYYAGLAEAQLGRRERALALLEKAVALPQARAADGPGYMWQAARLHWEGLLKGGAKASDAK